MITLNLEETIRVTKYQTIDGTIFNTQSECVKYEESAKCVLLAKYKDLVIKSDTEWSLFHIGSEENIIDIVKLESYEDVDTVLQLIALNHPSMYDNKNSEWLSKIKNRLEEAVCENSLICIGRGYDEENFYLSCTFLELENKLNSFKQ